MNKSLLHILLLLILNLTSISSHATSIQLPATGQTTIQAAGDDGAIQTGKPWRVPRFTDNRNGTIRDNLTGLIWSGDANPLHNQSFRCWQSRRSHLAAGAGRDQAAECGSISRLQRLATAEPE